MTTIAMQVRGREVVACGDTLVTGSSGAVRGPPKVWASGRVCWGFAGCMLLRDWAARNPPPAGPDGDALVAWADALRARAVETGQYEGGQYAGEALIGYAAPHACLVLVGCDGAVIRLSASAYAIGSGAQYAIGALDLGATPTQAVMTASRYDPTTGDERVTVEAAP
jgi:ATP-dependent protease HslVU (ClpYQ) peptidase subunit